MNASREAQRMRQLDALVRRFSGTSAEVDAVLLHLYMQDGDLLSPHDLLTLEMMEKHGANGIGREATGGSHRLL